VGGGGGGGASTQSLRPDLIFAVSIIRLDRILYRWDLRKDIRYIAGLGCFEGQRQALKAAEDKSGVWRLNR
jgi:hypothetical protein